MASATGPKARLRRTFHFPDDDNSDSSQLEAMDEQEQEDFIARLAAENTARNEQFQTVLLAIPLVASLPYLPLLIRPYSTLPSLLSITSLLSTAFLLRRLPPTVTGIAPLDAWSRREDVAATARNAGARLHQTARLGGRSPLEEYLPYLNLGLVIVLALMGLVADVDRGGSAGLVGMANLPALVYIATLVAKVVMGSVDPERELSALKYDYKGA